MPNGRKPRRHEFLFSPRDYLSDPAVLAMSLESRGAYSTLLFELWDMPAPGVVIDHDASLAALSRSTPQEWKRVREQVVAAFDADGRPGYLVQKRMVAEHERQTAFIEEARRTGRMGGLKRASRVPKATVKRPSTGSSVTSVVSVSSGSAVADDGTNLKDYS